MRSAEVDFHFPLLGFTPDKALWTFADRYALAVVGKDTLKERLHDGMELIDSDQRRWIIRSTRRTGRGSPFLNWLFSMLVFYPISQIDHELDELPPITFPEIRNRASAAIELHPFAFLGDEDENGESPHLKEVLAEVRDAKCIADIFETVGPMPLDY